ncbi:hypothetical protein CLV98_101790 [Dyadobacter jejuensis]|uniref:Uncharacterized protein n=1 Tax=Dyadobacter jejuensis TaxID=1082580 RepID=A0A316ASD8_9BACT|nr:hypothetical protein [Dyadobacter jejuensis]PWJ60605.1 hypothetical protein CLV98_101790 [Dyadobacter jejuensis]
MKTNQHTIDELERLLSEYIQEIENSNLQNLSAQMYTTQSINFVRWVKGDYTPKGRARKTLA